MKKILITGSGGFIGQRLVNAITDDIILLSREKRRGFDTIICDYENEVIPRNSLKNIDIVFHLAGYAHQAINKNNPHNIYEKINVDFTLELAELAIENDVKSFVFVSSVKAGGLATFGECADESNQNLPEDIYGKTKREAELGLIELSKNSNTNFCIIRPSLVYGPGMKGNLKQMLSGIEQNWFPPLPETFNRRSMIHVDDLVKALLLVAENNNTDGQIFIATDGNLYSSREIYEVMCKVLGKKVPFWTMPKFLFSILSFLNPTMRYKIKKLLGDECYSSKKLESIGFKPQRVLKEMNETFF